MEGQHRPFDMTSRVRDGENGPKRRQTRRLGPRYVFFRFVLFFNSPFYFPGPEMCSQRVLGPLFQNGPKRHQTRRLGPRYFFLDLFYSLILLFTSQGPRCVLNVFSGLFFIIF